MDRFKSLQVFVAIADLGSFRRAATQLRMSPAMVTTHLNRLEQQLGARLISRTTRRLDLTEQGRAFLKNARHILDLLGAAERSLTRAGNLPAGRVRIDAPTSIGTVYLVPALTALRKEYPDIVVDLTLGDRGTLFRADGFDILVRVGEVPTSELIGKALGMTRLVLVAAPDYLARRGIPDRPEAVLDHDCILYSSVDSPGGDSWRFERAGEARRISAPATLTFNDGHAITAAAVAGNGLAQNLEMLVVDEIADGRLVRVLPEFCETQVWVTLACPRDRQELPAVRAAFDYLASRVEWGIY